MNAEWLAFTFTENYRGDEGFEWGTYYGPLGVFVDANGKRVERPSVEEVTAEILMYWEQRAQAARHPTLRMRYADVVWEFGRRAKQSVTADLPRLVIDATLLSSKSGLFPDSHEGFIALKRALDLALSLRDEERVVAVRDALVAYEARVADDSLAGTWGRAFDELVENKPKNVPMPPDLIAKLVSDLEARLDRLAHPGAPGSLPDGFAVEAAALPLARHYRRTGDGAAMRRALRIFG